MKIEEFEQLMLEKEGDFLNKSIEEIVEVLDTKEEKNLEKVKKSFINLKYWEKAVCWGKIIIMQKPSTGLFKELGGSISTRDKLMKLCDLIFTLGLPKAENKENIKPSHIKENKLELLFDKYVDHIYSDMISQNFKDFYSYRKSFTNNGIEVRKEVRIVDYNKKKGFSVFYDSNIEGEFNSGDKNYTYKGTGQRKNGNIFIELTNGHEVIYSIFNIGVQKIPDFISGISICIDTSDTFFNAFPRVIVAKEIVENTSNKILPKVEKFLFDNKNFLKLPFIPNFTAFKSKHNYTIENTFVKSLLKEKYFHSYNIFYPGSESINRGSWTFEEIHGKVVVTRKGNRGTVFKGEINPDFIYDKKYLYLILSPLTENNTPHILPRYYIFDISQFVENDESELCKKFEKGIRTIMGGGNQEAQLLAVKEILYPGSKTEDKFEVDDRSKVDIKALGELRSGIASTLSFVNRNNKLHPEVFGDYTLYHEPLVPSEQKIIPHSFCIENIDDTIVITYKKGDKEYLPVDIIVLERVLYISFHDLKRKTLLNLYINTGGADEIEEDIKIGVLLGTLSGINANNLPVSKKVLLIKKTENNSDLVDIFFEIVSDSSISLDTIVYSKDELEDYIKKNT